jgi:cytochrome P450
MTEFVPPFPKRHKKPLSPLKAMFRARHDLLSIWCENDFRKEFQTMRIRNQPVFLANCPELVRYVLVAKNSNYERKSPQMEKALEPLLGDGLFISHGETWRIHRDIEKNLFTHKRIEKYSRVMTAAAEELVERWAVIKPGSTINVLPEMAQLTAEIICRTLFASRLGQERSRQIVSSFTDYQRGIEQMDVGTLIGLPSWLPKFKSTRVTKATRTIHRVVDEVISQRQSEKEDDSLLSHLLEANERCDGSVMSLEQIRNELLVLFMAGHETTANSLAWTWYLISQCPSVERRLHEEIECVIGNRRPTYDDVPKLTYTNAVFNESMRLYPPVPLLSRQASADDEIRNQRIPTGSIMMVVPWLLHRHEKYWEKPDHFIPERFLPDASNKPEKFAYIPFSAGPRVCLARVFGLVEAVLCIAIIARRFRLCLPAHTRITHDCRLTLRPKNGLPMQLMQR